RADVQQIYGAGQLAGEHLPDSARFRDEGGEVTLERSDVSSRVPEVVDEVNAGLHRVDVSGTGRGPDQAGRFADGPDVPMHDPSEIGSAEPDASSACTNDALHAQRLEGRARQRPRSNIDPLFAPASDVQLGAVGTQRHAPCVPGPPA